MRRILYIFLLTPIIILFVSFCFWYFQHKTKVAVLIVDKTVLTDKCNEHRSFNWILTHLRYVDGNENIYNVKNYMGFVPGKNQEYKIRDLENYSEKQLDSLAHALDMVYFTDTYGVYENEWYLNAKQTERSKKIYGGLSEKDFELLKRMKERKKLILTEFNLLASPTTDSIREITEQLLGLKWSGWVGRYFSKLDTIKNGDLPKWAIQLYEKQYNKPWQFKRNGLVFVSNKDQIVVLEDRKQLKKPVPYITTVDSIADQYGVIDFVHYPFWFDITLPLNDSNIVMSYFNIFPNERGAAQMRQYNIPTRFPAIIKHRYNNFFYYFCGDFADNHVPYRFSYFEGIRPLSFMLYRKLDQSERMMFFWEFYIPLIEHIMELEFRKKD
jgi:hypothetical protein